MGSRLLLSLLGAFLLLASAASAGGLVPNPANHRAIVDKPIEDFRYDRADACRKEVPRGTKELEDWLERNVRGESWGIFRCERLRGGNFSVHSEGRAIDWHLDAGVAKERRAAMRLIRTLLAGDRYGNQAALARRMGVQGLIFDCKSWWSGMEKLGDYSYCFKRNGDLRNDLDRTQAHRDHVHIELNWPGARERTSFWHSKASRL
jgi:hypothetical protein